MPLKLEHHRVPETACPHCGTKINAVGSGVLPHPPQTGDLSICLECTAPLVFDGNLALRLFSPDEFAALAPEERADLLEMLERVRAYKEWQAGLN